MQYSAKWLFKVIQGHLISVLIKSTYAACFRWTMATLFLSYRVSEMLRVFCWKQSPHFPYSGQNLGMFSYDVRAVRSEDRKLIVGVSTRYFPSKAYKNSGSSSFHLSLKRPPSLKFLSDPEKYWCSFFVRLQSFTETKLFASSLLWCSIFALVFSWALFNVSVFYELLFNITQKCREIKIKKMEKKYSPIPTLWPDCSWKHRHFKGLTQYMWPRYVSVSGGQYHALHCVRRAVMNIIVLLIILILQQI